MKNIYILLFLATRFFSPTHAQPSLQWQKTFGGSENDNVYAIKQTPDGGYIAVGRAFSGDGDVLGFKGVADYWVLKLDAAGNLEWQRTYGGSNHDWPFDVALAHGGGYVISGVTLSDDDDVTNYHGGDDAWVIKINENGDLIWQVALGGSDWDEGWSIVATPDGGYAMAGFSASTDGDLSHTPTDGLDFWVVKFRGDGTIAWHHNYGGSASDLSRFIGNTSDGGFIVVGETFSNDGDVSGNNGNVDYWVIKLDSIGNLQWQKALGGEGTDTAIEAYETAGGYIVFGYSGSYNTGNVSGHHGLFDYWVVKLNFEGDIIWQKALGGSNSDWLYTGLVSSDGGYLLAGHTRSNDGDIALNQGGDDIWLVKLDSNGVEQWQKSIGGTLWETCYSIAPTQDNGFVLGGYTWSTDGDASGSANKGRADYWIVKLSPEDLSSPANAPALAPLTFYPNPASLSVLVEVPEAQGLLQLTLTDLLGRPLLQQTIPNGAPLEISHLPPGMYQATAATTDGRVFAGVLVKT